MGNSFLPGDVELGDLNIEGSDFSQHFTSMMFQEHLFAPFVRGVVNVSQQHGAQSQFDGSTDSSITFSTPNGQKRKYSFMRTNGVGGVHADENQRTRMFSIDLVSKHALINNATPNYQKSFRNKQISSVVESIVKEGLGLEIPFNIDQTRGLQGSDYQPIILTQRSPLRHLDELRRMAVSSKDYDGFLLFSGIGASGGEELNFKSIYEMIGGESVASLTNKTKFEVNSDINGLTMDNVIEMWYPQQTSTMEKGAAFSGGTTKFDVNTLKAEVPRLEAGAARQEYGSDTSLNPGKVSGFVHDPYNGMPGTGNVILEDSRRPDTHRAETAAYTEALFADMMQNYLTVKVPGNSNLKVGDVIDFEFRENTENNLNNDTQFYGKNLIVGVTNYIGPISDRPRYVTYLDLVNIQTYRGKIA